MSEIPTGESTYKRIFQEFGIRNIDIARKIGKSFSSVNRYLNGYAPIPPEVQTKFNEYIEELRKDTEKPDKE